MQSCCKSVGCRHVESRFLNETEQTNETQTNFECFVQCALFLLQLDFVCLSVGECIFFAVMAC